MKTIALLLSIFIISLTNLQAQKNDFVWHLGYGEDSPLASVIVRSSLNFKHYYTESFVQLEPKSKIDLDETIVSAADEQGNFLFLYNGNTIENAAGEIMENAQNLNPTQGNYGEAMPQCGLMLPMPEADDIYILFHNNWKFYDEDILIAGYQLHYSLIDMSPNNGLGKVIERRQLILEDTLSVGKLTATRHANGRDWWVILPKHDGRQVHRFLLSPKGVLQFPIQHINQVIRNGLGQAHFSPDGSKYLVFSAVSDTEGEFLHFFDFDRCTGLLSNPNTYQFNAGPWTVGGACFSPDSKKLYLNGHTKIYQFDLTASDALASKQLVAEHDNYYDTIVHPITHDTFYVFPSFYLSQLAPDGKIYICSKSTTQVYTTIDNPNKLGTACEVNQHSLKMPTIHSHLPNFPNYRLGPIDGSSCDTLGIDNIPLARFRYDRQSKQSLEVEFIDLSDYEPETWSWDFGDGSPSNNERNPVHNYAAYGQYEVCLTVSNVNGSHTSCQLIQYLPSVSFTYATDSLSVDFASQATNLDSLWWDFGDGSAGSSQAAPQHSYAQPGSYTVCLYGYNQNGSSSYCDTVVLSVTTTATATPAASDIHIYPIPARDHLSIEWPAELSVYRIRLVDMQGREHYRAQAGLRSHRMSVSALPAGTYVCVLELKDGSRLSRQLVVSD